MAHNFTVEQKPLLTILSSMQPICTKRTPLETTTSILFQVGHKELVLKSTDLEISLQSSCSITQSDIDETQTFLVSGKRMFDIVKELDGTIDFTFQNNQLTLKSGKVKLSLNIKDAQEFPPFPERIENLMHIESDYLLKLLDKVAFLIPQNNANPSLNGLLFEIDNEQLKLTATDGHCLAQIKSTKYTLETAHKWLLPRRAIIEIKKILEVCEEKTTFVGVCGNQLVFSGESFNFFTKLLNDQFPQYNAILQKEGFMPAVVERSQFVKTLRRSTCLLSGQFLATQFGFDKQQLNVSMQNKEVGNLQEDIPLQKFEGAKLDVRFYAPYLLNGINAFSEDQLTFYLNSAAKPIIFESNQDDIAMTYLVMPVSQTN